MMQKYHLMFQRETLIFSYEDCILLVYALERYNGKNIFICLHVWRNPLRCGVSDLEVSGSRPPVATRRIRYVLLVNSPNVNLLSWLLIYLCNINKVYCTKH